MSDRKLWLSMSVLWTILLAVRIGRHFRFCDGLDSVVVGNVLWGLSRGMDTKNPLTGQYHFASHLSWARPGAGSPF